MCDTTCYQDQHRSVHSALDHSHRVASRGWGMRNVCLSLSLSFLSSSPSSPSFLHLLPSCSDRNLYLSTHRYGCSVCVCAHTSAGTCTHNMQHPEAGASRELILRSDAHTLVSIPSCQVTCCIYLLYVCFMSRGEEQVNLHHCRIQVGHSACEMTLCISTVD